MVSQQLNCNTPDGDDGMTACLSDDTRVVGHAARQFKAGYVTVSRFSSDSSKWRNVHIAKRSFEKFKEHAAQLLSALMKGESYQIRMTSRQFAMVTKFQRGDRDTLYHVSLLHPRAEQEVLNDSTDCLHSKTINLRKEEFQKLYDVMPRLHEVITTPCKDTEKPFKAEESTTIQAFRWSIESRGMKSHTLYPTKEECEQSATAYIAGLPNNENSAYVVEELKVSRSSKMDILEHVFCGRVLDKTGYSWGDLMLHAPSEEAVTEAMNNVTKTEVVQIAEQIAVKLGHKRLYIMSDVYDIFVYFGGVQRSKEILIKTTVTPPAKMADRLLEYCYRKVVINAPSAAVAH